MCALAPRRLARAIDKGFSAGEILTDLTSFRLEGHVVLASCLGDEDTGGGLFAYNGHSLERIDRLSSTGICLLGDRLARVLRSRGDTDTSSDILIYDSSGVRSYFRLDELSDPHDIAWDGSCFVAVSTFSNKVLWISPSGSVEKKWAAPGSGDARHLNCVAFQNGRVLLSAFGRFKNHLEWAQNLSEPTGILFDVETDLDVVKGLSHPHSPRFVDGEWLICNSLKSQLWAIETLSDHPSKVVRLEGYTRGLAVSDGFLFVGESANRGLNPGTRKMASIAVVSRLNWKVVERVQLPCREIYDLVLIPKKLAEGVRVGFRTNSLRTAERNQYAMFDEVGVEPVRLWAVGDPLPPEACRIKVKVSLPSTMAAGSLVELDCEVENLDGAILVSAAPYPVHVSYKWIDPVSLQQLEGTEGLRSRLPRTLVPKQSLRCKLRVNAPAVCGTFILRVTLVQEYVAWFDDIMLENSSSAAVSILE